MRKTGRLLFICLMLGLSQGAWAVDTDGDGVEDAMDVDDDNDGVPDVSDDFPLALEAFSDTDGDGMPDTVGEVIEGFESGGFTGSRLWQFSGAEPPWSVTTVAKVGIYDAGGSFSNLVATQSKSIEVQQTSGNVISFWVVVGPWSGFQMRFYVDGALKKTWFGDNTGSWLFYELPVTSGTHIFKWTITGNYLAGYPTSGGGSLDHINFGSPLLEDWDDDNDGVPDNIDAAPLNSGDVSEITLPLDGSYKGLQLGAGQQHSP